MFNTNNTPKASSSSQNRDQMHPEDMRNMFIFFFIAVLLYVGYNHYVLQPQRDAMRAAQQAQAELDANPNNPVAKKIQEAQNPLSREDALAAQSTARITIDNGVIQGSLAMKGGRINDMKLLRYFETLEQKKNVAVLSPNRTDLPRYIEYGWVSSDSSLKLPGKETVWKVQGNTNLTPTQDVTLVWDNGAGLLFKRILHIDEQYAIRVTQLVTNTSGQTVTLYPYGLVSQRGVPKNFAATWFSHEGPLGYIGDELAQHSYKDMRKTTSPIVKNAQKGWFGITDKYWLTALIPPQGETVKYSFNYSGPAKKDPDNIGRYQADYLGEGVTLLAGESSEYESTVFIGAKKLLTLQDYEKSLNVPKLDLALNFGLLWFMAKPFFYFLHYAGQMVGNFGIAIILLTVLIRGAVFPLTNMSYRSFAGMKKVGPQIAVLREQYADDKQKMQEELVKLYQKENVNPMSGCLPILIQIPIFFSLYRVLFMTIEMRHAPFFGWIQDLSAADPTSIFNLFGLIPWDPPQILMFGVWPCLLLLAMIIQKNLNPPPTDKIQRDMARYMPFFFAFIMSKMAAGLVIYWTFSAFIGVIQQIIIMRSMHVPIHLFGETSNEEIEEANAEEAAEEAAKKSKAKALHDDVVDEVKKQEDETPKKISPPKRKKSKKKK